MGCGSFGGCLGSSLSFCLVLFFKLVFGWLVLAWVCCHAHFQVTILPLLITVMMRGHLICLQRIWSAEVEIEDEYAAFKPFDGLMRDYWVL